MKYIGAHYFLFVGVLVSCTNTYDVCEMQRNETEDMSSRIRSHGTDTPREIWNFGEKGTMFYDVIEKVIKLRYHLMPYIYSLAGAVHFNDYIVSLFIL